MNYSCIFCAFAALTVGATPLLAQPIDLECSVLSSGGVAGAQATLVLGQPFAGVLTAGAVTLKAGFVPCAIPTCPADFNNSGNVSSADITAFLSAWFADLQNGTLVADFNASGATTSADITAFLAAWFAALQNGC
ncbi:MAG: hypothetical protein H7Y88_06560 [Phycisphaerales bacterium]|nr:hypothetical protein [Phycisphaerales bacterium]